MENDMDNDFIPRLYRDSYRIMVSDFLCNCCIGIGYLN